MPSNNSPFSSIIKFTRFSPFYQFWLNIIIPFCGIIFFHWSPGSVLFCFVIELVNYWLCNTVLLQFYVTDEAISARNKNVLKFSGYFIASIISFYYFVAMFSDPKSEAMQTNVTYGQIIWMTALYWTQFGYYLWKENPKGKVTTASINKEVFNRMTGIYLVLFCIMCYVFSFWSNTDVANYALAFVLIFAKSLVDLVFVAMRMSDEIIKKRELDGK